jgi:hypothetical protein
MDALLILDCNTQILLETNETSRSLLCYTKSEPTGKPFTLLFPEGRSGIDAPINVYGSVICEEFRKKDGPISARDLTAVP